MHNCTPLHASSTADEHNPATVSTPAIVATADRRKSRRVKVGARMNCHPSCNLRCTYPSPLRTCAFANEFSQLCERRWRTVRAPGGVAPRVSFSPLFATNLSLASSDHSGCSRVQFPRSTDNPIYTRDYSRHQGWFRGTPPQRSRRSSPHHPCSSFPLPSTLVESRCSDRREPYLPSIVLSPAKHGRFQLRLWPPAASRTQGLLFLRVCRLERNRSNEIVFFFFFFGRCRSSTVT